MKYLFPLLCLLLCWRTASSQPNTETPRRSLIVYFSWGGNTARVATALHRATGAKLLRIEPQTPYPDNYVETLLRARSERNAIYEREEYPPIYPHNEEELTACDTIFICYPLWLGKVAMPMQSFLRRYRAILTEKVLIPVCSSGKSDAAKTLPDLGRLCPAARWQALLAIKRSQAEQTEEIVAQWVANGFRPAPAEP